MPPAKKNATKAAPKGKAKTCDQCRETLGEVRALFARLEARMDVLHGDIKAALPTDHPASPDPGQSAEAAPSADKPDTSPTIPAGV